MKLTTKILLALLLLLMSGVLLSNAILKKEYDNIDKTDMYWTYKAVLQQPFKYLKINGGNITRIAFEQSPKYSVRILQEWKHYHDGKIKAHVSNDTLYINFDFVSSNEYEKYWMKGITAVRIFSPQLFSVDGYNTNFEMNKLKQKSIAVNMSGKSKFEIESLYPEMDSINIVQRDSTAVVFEMSPDYRKSSLENQPQGKVEFHNAAGVAVVYPNLKDDFTESMAINKVVADIKGYSILDVGHAQIRKLQAQVSDSSAIVLSGNALRKVNSTGLER